MVTTVGWINIFLIIIMGSIYPIKHKYMLTYKNEGKEKAKALGQLYRFSRKVHPVTGVLILLLGFYHGSQAYSLTVLHTGTILLYSILLMAIVALVGQKVRAFNKHWRIVHRGIGIFVFLFAVLHIFWRNIL
ncbi:UNVERIFIED_CONTAM: hypothetical protein Cloal_2854 [Acetivibrio alkalicellulosi]